jgi:RNA polymerase sigma-70 factor, ECF subfamily
MLLASSHSSRAVAVGLASGADAARAARRLALERYQPVHATHAELISRASDAAGAAGAYKRAIAVTANAIERAELERRLRARR